MSNAELKIDRADQHIAELQRCIRDYLETDFYSLRAYEDQWAGQELLEFGFIKPVPYGIALIAGDAIHNLRTALQFTFCDVVNDVNGDFPIFGSNKADRKKLEKCVENGIKRKWPAGVADILLNTIKPHPTWYDTLWAIHRLDVADKHQLLIPTLGVASITADVVDQSGAVCGTIYSPELFVPAGHTIRAAETLGYPAANCALQIRKDRKPAFLVLFGKGLPMENQPVVPTLHHFSELVRETVKLFEAV